ncbi:hypothetical protein F383_39128 [Gossypium arboreum]|uniref:Uncharacterized protein n=1 Tax=Gossypium arboreum TaxID=29729 RepID=A0A0B0MPX8_GOSAR|nr:hypothetical protein F383_39128 [Gossypium arboreum]
MYIRVKSRRLRAGNISGLNPAGFVLVIYPG